jgi:hypothetical protein
MVECDRAGCQSNRSTAQRWRLGAQENLGQTLRPEAPGVIKWQGTKRETAMSKTCTHLNQIHKVHPSGNGCKECLEMGDTWVHLRLCLSCGHVGCCDSSKNKHATKHFHTVHHPIVQSFEPGEDWRWFYVDEMFLE